MPASLNTTSPTRNTTRQYQDAFYAAIKVAVKEFKGTLTAEGYSHADLSKHDNSVIRQIQDALDTSNRRNNHLEVELTRTKEQLQQTLQELDVQKQQLMLAEERIKAVALLYQQETPPINQPTSSGKKIPSTNQTSLLDYIGTAISNKKDNRKKPEQKLVVHGVINLDSPPQVNESPNLIPPEDLLPKSRRKSAPGPQRTTPRSHKNDKSPKRPSVFQNLNAAQKPRYADKPDKEKPTGRIRPTEKGLYANPEPHELEFFEIMHGEKNPDLQDPRLLQISKKRSRVPPICSPQDYWDNDDIPEVDYEARFNDHLRRNNGDVNATTSRRRDHTPT
jgi:hypothetical protein